MSKSVLNAISDDRHKMSAYYAECHKADMLTAIKNQIYSVNDFECGVFSWKDRTYDKAAKCTIHFFSFEMDTIVLKCDISRAENSGLKTWCQHNMAFVDGVIDPGAPRVGGWCSTPVEPNHKLKIETLDETAFFPVRDRVAMLKNVIVLSGCDAKPGSSGAPVFDSDGKIIGMIVGRSRQGQEYKYLAVNVGGVLGGFSKTQRRAIEAKGNNEQVG